MAGPLDHQLTIASETTYATAVTPSRSYEWDVGNSNHNWDPKAITGSGMQVGDGGIPRASRAVSIVGQGSGTVGLDLQTKGMGLLLNSVFGNGSSTLVSGTTYQQVFSSASIASLLPSYTVQYGLVRSDAAGTVDAFTYRGTTFTKLTIACASQDVTKVSLDWDAMAQTTATALATPAYPTGLLDPVHFGDWAATFGGTVTVPTTTALASVSGGATVSDFKDFTFEWDRQTDNDRWVLGGARNQPRASMSQPTLAITAEYSSLTYDAAMTGFTTNSIVLTATKSTQALSSGFATVQLVFPSVKLFGGGRPSPSTSTPTMSLNFNVLKPDTGAACYLVIRTSDIAL